MNSIHSSVRRCNRAEETKVVRFATHAEVSSLALLDRDRLDRLFAAFFDDLIVAADFSRFAERLRLFGIGRFDMVERSDDEFLKCFHCESRAWLLLRTTAKLACFSGVPSQEAKMHRRGPTALPKPLGHGHDAERRRNR